MYYEESNGDYEKTNVIVKDYEKTKGLFLRILEDERHIYIYIYIYIYVILKKKVQYDNTFLKHKIWTKYVYVYSFEHLINILYNINLDLKDFKSIKFHSFALIFFFGFNKNESRI